MPRHEFRPIQYTEHARERMQRRGVREQEVEHAIRAGAWRPNGGARGGWVARVQAHSTTLDVVFVETTGRDGRVVIEVLLVVTVIDVGRYER